LWPFFHYGFTISKQLKEYICFIAHFYDDFFNSLFFETGEKLHCAIAIAFRYVPTTYLAVSVTLLNLKVNEMDEILWCARPNDQVGYGYTQQKQVSSFSLGSNLYYCVALSRLHVQWVLTQ